MFSHTANLGQRKKDAEEVMEFKILKTELIDLFKKQKNNRTGTILSWTISKIFRDWQLVLEKNKLIDQTITAIRDFAGTRDDLIEMLGQYKQDNSTLSINAEKNHFNLNREEGDLDYNKVKRGESFFKSELAEIFNQAIAIVKNFTLLNEKEIRVNLLNLDKN